MDDLISAWNNYLKLERQHSSDIDEFGNGIHACQHQLAIRIARREFPEG